MSTATNFNYQVALKEGLKSLQQGRLRQAEQSFRYLVEKFPGAEGGYRGLAKVHFEQEDRTGALKVLRDGAAALTRSGERSAAIGLLREAVTLDPRDLGTHRRLAAALALAGDAEAAVQEYTRFIRDLRDSGDADRAKLEATYGVGQLKDAPGVAALHDLANGETPQTGSSAGESPRDETIRAAFGGTTALRPKAADPWEAVPPPPNDAQLWSRPSPTFGSARPAAPSAAGDPWISPPQQREETAPVEPAQSDVPMEEAAPEAEAPAPVETAPTPATLQEEDAPGRDHVMILSDDIYSRLVYGGAQAPNLLRIAPDLTPRTVLINGASKAYALRTRTTPSLADFMSAELSATDAASAIRAASAKAESE